MFSISNFILSSSKIRTFIIGVSIVTVSGAGLMQPACADDQLLIDSFSDSNGNLLSRPSDTKLEGGVQKDEKGRDTKGRELKRDDIDVFSKDSIKKPSDEILVPSPGDFDIEPTQLPKFEIDINQNGGQFDGVPGGGLIDTVPPEFLPPPQQDMLPVPPKQISGDPDATRRMQIAWELWHKRLAANVYLRFNVAAQNFHRPLYAEVTYDVTADGRVINIRLLRRSPDMIFNATLLGVIKTLQGNSILRFPEGSHRQVVAKRGVFTRNWGNQNGFKHETGDVEQKTIPAQDDPFKQGR